MASLGDEITVRPGRSGAQFGDPAERRFWALTRGSALVVWVTDENGDVVEDSPSWRNFTGQTFAQWRGRGWLDAVHPADRDMAYLNWRNAVRSQTRFETTYRIKHVSGEWRWVSARGFPVFDDGGRIDCWVGLCDDITLKINADNARAESETMFRTLAEATPNFVYLADPDGRIFYFNPRWHEYTGLSPSESLGLLFVEVIREDVRADAYARWATSVREQINFEMELPVRAHDGGYEWFLARARPVFDDAGKLIRWMGVLANVNEQRVATEALWRERRDREQFVAALVHDLKNAFGSSASAMQGLLEDGTTDADRVVYRRVIESAYGRVDRMITDLLDANALQAGQAYRPKNAGPFALADVFADLSQSWATARGRRVHVEPCDADLIVRGDRGDVIRVIENLISNAEKYGDPARTVTLGARRARDRRDRIEIYVHNFGTPIPATERDGLFDFLKRANSSASEPGWGIGLTLVRGIVEGHGGSIRVDSNAADGTTFTVSLPADA